MDCSVSDHLEGFGGFGLGVNVSAIYALISWVGLGKFAAREIIFGHL